MLADRVRMGSGGKKDLILYNKGNIYTEYGRTKNFSNSRGGATITFNSDHFNMHTYSLDDITITRAMVGFKIPPNLPPDSKILVKYSSIDLFIVALAPSISYLNARETLPLTEIRQIGTAFGTGEIILPLGNTTGYEVVGVASDTWYSESNIRIERIEVIV